MSDGRILIVDDEPQIRRVLKASLSSHGYEVNEAKSGEEALQAIRDQRFDLVLLDMNMPGIGGLEACKEVRRSSEIAVIMLTVRDSEQDKVAALDAGADDYVTKPFGMPELLARIRAALRRLPVAEDETIRFGERVVINLATRRVLRDGKTLRLTPKEFELLSYLIAHPDTSISHAKLLQAVWGPDYGDQVEYLRVFMNQLRKKIELDPAQPRFLITEPWVGYRFARPTPS